jgi:thioredoxin 1
MRNPRCFPGAVLVSTFLLFSCNPVKGPAQGVSFIGGRPTVTFVELGSVNCIPCKAMQPIMQEIEAEFGSEVKVVFHDVWTDAGKPYVKEFAIRVIPTQVFLDKDGKEYFRHEGFFAKEDLVAVLKLKGVNGK